METLILGRELIRQEHWAEANEQFEIISKNKKWLSREERAESNFLYGYSLEKLGKLDKATTVCNAVLAVYGFYAEWSCQSLERGFNLAFQTKDHEKKIKAYSNLKKQLYRFQMIEASEDPSGAITRMRKRHHTVKNELGITAEEDAAIDLSLGIRPEDRKNAQENEKINK
ncbi:MAG: hypothetical protein L3J39_03895 [Verrucomicrobiales bacterium]|nr:hypothetical protein [Verrucomicrobiales bacterium]